MSLRGNLNSVDLANIFQMLSINQKEGTLNIFDGASKKSIYFSSEGVCMLSRGKAHKDSLGQILLRYDRITEEQLERTLGMQQKSPKLLGAILVESGMVSREVIDDALRIQIEEEIYNLFIWKDASFEFIEGPPAQEFNEVDGALTRLTFNVNSLIMEAARRIDEWDHIQTLIPDVNEIFRYSGKNMELNDDIFRELYCEKVLAAINGKNQVEEIIDRSHVNRFEVCKILSLLLTQGAIEPMPIEDLAKIADASIAKGDVQDGIKFLERVIELGGDTPETHHSLGEAFEAIEEIGRAATYYRRYAEDKLEAGDPEESFRLYQKICDLLPTDLKATDRLVEIYFSHVEEIDDHSKEVVKRGKVLATILQELGKNNRAVQTLLRIVTLAPDDLTLRNLLVNLYLANNMSEEAIEEYEAMVEYFTRKKDWEQVIILLRKILVIDSSRDDLSARLDQIVSRRENRQRGVKRLLVTMIFVGGLAFLGYAYIDYELAARGRIAETEDWVAKISSTLAPDVVKALKELKALQEGLDHPDADVGALIATFRRAEKLEAQYQSQIRSAIGQLGIVAEEFRFTTARKQAAERQEALESKLGAFEGQVELARGEIQARAVTLGKQANGLLLDGQGSEALVRFKKAWALAIDRTPLEKLDVPEKVARLEADLSRIAELIAEMKKRIDAKQFVEAREVSLRLISEFFVPEILERTTLPMLVETVPPGAKIRLDDEPSGLATPAWVTWRPGRELTVSLDLIGYETAEVLLPAVAIHMQKSEIERLGKTGKIRRYLEKVLSWQDSVGEPVYARPVVIDGAAYLATRESRIYRIDPKAKKRELVYEAKSLGGIVAGPAAVQGFLHFATVDGELVRLSLRTKQPVWSKKLPGRVYAPLTQVGAYLLVGDLSGKLSAFEAETGILLWRKQVAGQIRSQPAVHDGKVFVTSTAGHLYAFALSSGVPYMDVVPGEEARDALGDPFLEGDLAYVGSSDGTLYAYDIARKEKVWSHELGTEVRAAPIVVNGVLLISGMDGRLYTFKNSELKSTLELGGAIPCPPTVVGSRLYITSDRGRVLCAEMGENSLKELWRYDLGGEEGPAPKVLVPAVCIGRLVLIISEDGEVYAFDR